jgi:hypothetical protein
MADRTFVRIRPMKISEHSRVKETWKRSMLRPGELVTMPGGVPAVYRGELAHESLDRMLTMWVGTIVGVLDVDVAVDAEDQMLGWIAWASVGASKPLRMHHLWVDAPVRERGIGLALFSSVYTRSAAGVLYMVMTPDGRGFLDYVFQNNRVV